MLEALHVQAPVERTIAVLVCELSCGYGFRMPRTLVVTKEIRDELKIMNQRHACKAVL